MKKYPVITLCGSTRFKDEFYKAQKELTLQGYIVISVGLFGHSGDEEVWDGMDEDTLSHTKIMLDDMHKRKIDMADAIYVVNPGGYIGDSTKSEIVYACIAGKSIKSREPIDLEAVHKAAEDRIKRAEDIAWKNADSMIHQGEYANGGREYPYIEHNGKKIYDPWADDNIQMTDEPLTNHTGKDPFKRYGRAKMAPFVEEIITEHDKG